MPSKRVVAGNYAKTTVQDLAEWKPHLETTLLHVRFPVLGEAKRDLTRKKPNMRGSNSIRLPGIQRMSLPRGGASSGIHVPEVQILADKCGDCA